VYINPGVAILVGLNGQAIVDLVGVVRVYGVDWQLPQVQSFSFVAIRRRLSEHLL
jgi:hypothetical protein